jgi:hypothetical protein
MTRLLTLGYGAASAEELVAYDLGSTPPLPGS